MKRQIVAVSKGRRQFITAASASADEMLNAFESKLQQLAGNDIETSTDVTCNQYIDTDGMFGEPGAVITDEFMQQYWDDEYENDPSLQEYGSFEEWKADTLPWLSRIDANTEEVDEDLEPVNGEFDDVEASLIVNEEEVADTIEDIECVPANDPINASLIIDGEEVADTIEDIECQTIMDGEEVAEPMEEDALEDTEACGDVPVEASHADRYYFGQEAAAKYGDLIAENLAGQTVSKRKDLAEEPGGLIYEANLLGIDMWDLLEALEGMCHEGRAMEIDDSTYRVN